MKKLDQLYREIQPNIYAFFYVKTSNKSVAEDLTHDVFYQACKGIKTFKGNSTLKTWLFSIANNLLKKYYRSKKYQADLRNMLKEEWQNMPKTPEETLVMSEKMQALIEKVNLLPEDKREIIILRIYGELSFKEIGELVGKSENFARVNFHRTKIQLQTEMEEKK